MTRQTWLVTGGAGFIGANTVQALASRLDDLLRWIDAQATDAGAILSAG